eukprot:gene3717-4237_t
MNFKFVTGLLNIAVALSLFDWKNNNEQELQSFGTFLPPVNVLQGQTGRDSHRMSNLRPSKENESVIDSIINWEESQRSNRYNRDNVSLVAYPILSQQNSPFHHDFDTQSSGASLNLRPNLEVANLPTSVEEPVSPGDAWIPSSPSSSFEDGELFGAVGYTPQDSTDYFDIESFLNNVSFPSPSSSSLSSSASFEDAANGGVFPPPNWINGSPSESLEELAEFLQASIASPESGGSPDFMQEESFTPPVPNQSSYQNFMQESLHELYKESKQGLASAFSDIAFEEDKKMSNIEAVFGDEFHHTSSSKGKGTQFADIESYRDAKKKEPILISKNKVKKEIASPFRDDEFNWEKSCSTSSLDSGSSTDFQKEGRKELLQDHKMDYKRIWNDLPYTKKDLVVMDIDEFNNLIASLEPLQQHVGRDIRRRGKNKLAARSCRKRKFEAVDSLGKVVDETERKKEELLSEKLMLQEEMAEIKRKTAFLYEHIFKNLRDERGQPYSNDDFALAYTGEGSVFLVPKSEGEQGSIHIRTLKGGREKGFGSILGEVFFRDQCSIQGCEKDGKSWPQEQ